MPRRARNLFRMRGTVLVAIFLALFCGTAAAQREGQYQGSLANGTALTITVDHNPSNGKLRIAAATLSFQTPCAGLGTGGDFAGHWSWTPNKDIVSQRTSMVFSNRFTYISVDLAVHGARFSGPLQFANSVLVPQSNGYRPTICGRRQWNHIDLRFVHPGGGGAAGAQQAGRYDGSSADGRAIGLVVADNPSTGHLEIVGATVASTCAFPSWSWAPNVDITGNKTEVAYFNGYSAIKFQVRFPTAATAAGGVVTRSALSRPRGGAPKRADLCLSPWQSFTLSYSGP